MDTTKDTTMQPATDAVIAEVKRAAEHPLRAPVIVRADAMLDIIAHIERLESDLATAEQDSRQKQARIERLEQAEKERDVLRDRLALESQENGALRDSVDRACEERDALRAAVCYEADCVEACKSEIEALRAKVERMEKQEPFDAGSDVFRSAFEAALKAGNWPATRQGDGYRSPSTQIAWRIAFSTVNRLKLYLAPAQKGEEK